MPTSTIQSALGALVAAAGSKNPNLKPGRKHPVIVTISRDEGTPGDEISQKLAKRLGVELYDKVLVEKLAERLDTDHKVVKALDDGVGRARDMWLYRLVTGVDVSPGTYRRHLVNVILSMARLGGVIVGRGAHVVLTTGAALRVRLIGTPEVCAERLAAEEGIDLNEAKAKIEKINSKRGKFVWDIFQSRLNEPHNFDIVINTDRMTDVDELVETLAHAVEAIHATLEAEETK